MKHLYLSLLAFIIAFSATAQHEHKNKYMRAWRYETQCIGEGKDGAYLFKVFSYSKKKTLATEQAKMNAVHAIIFKGISGNNCAAKPPLSNNPDLEEEQAEFFDNFFAEGGKYMNYVDFSTDGSVSAEDMLKIGNEYKIGVGVKINVIELRKYLEKKGIIKKVDLDMKKKPTIMVIPSDVWCVTNGYAKAQVIDGDTVFSTDYDKALQRSTDLVLAISAIGGIMTDAGYKTESLEDAIKNNRDNATEDAVTGIESGKSVATSVLDKIRQAHLADILIKLTLKKNDGLNKSVTVIIDGVDAYTGSKIAPAQGTGAVVMGNGEFDRLIREALIGRMPKFNAQLQDYFEDMLANGRDVTLKIKRWTSWSGNLEREYEGKELASVIEDWVSENTVNNSFNRKTSTANLLEYAHVRIPVYEKDNKKKPLDVKKFAESLKTMLQGAPYNIPCRVSSKGLGEATLILGAK